MLMKTRSLRPWMLAVVAVATFLACGGAEQSAPSPVEAISAPLEAPASGGGWCVVVKHSDGTWWQDTYCASPRPVGEGNNCPGQYVGAACAVKQVKFVVYDSICGLHQNPNSSCVY